MTFQFPPSVVGPQFGCPIDLGQVRWEEAIFLQNFRPSFFPVVDFATRDSPLFQETFTQLTWNQMWEKSSFPPFLLPFCFLLFLLTGATRCVPTNPPRGVLPLPHLERTTPPRFFAFPYL